MIKRLLKNLLRPLIQKLLAIANETPTGLVETHQASLSCWDLYKDYISIHPTAIIAPSATLKIFNLPEKPRVMFEVGEGSHIFSSFALLRPEASIRIGKNSQLGASSFISAERIEVGDDVLMAWGVTIMDNDSHPLKWENRQHDVRRCYEDYKKDPSNFIRTKDWTHVAKRAIYIGHRTWIGFGSSILKGVRVGDESVIGAGSVVTKDVAAGSVAVGNPARTVRP